MHLVMEYSRHYPLISCACIFQPKRHYSLVEITYVCFESGFLCNSQCHSNLVISIKSIHKGEHGISCCKVYQQVHVWQQEFILLGRLG